MRTITIQMWENGFKIEDCDGQSVDVEYDHNGTDSYFLSKYLDDDEFVAGSCHKEDAMAQALSMMGIF